MEVPSSPIPMLHFGIPVYIFAISFLKRMSPSHRIDACECSRTACRPIILPIRIRIRVRLFLGTWLNHLLRKPYPQKFSKFYSLWLSHIQLSHTELDPYPNYFFPNLLAYAFFMSNWTTPSKNFLAGGPNCTFLRNLPGDEHHPSTPTSTGRKIHLRERGNPKRGSLRHLPEGEDHSRGRGGR